MTSSTMQIEDSRVSNIRIDAKKISVELLDGRTLIVPILWFPRLMSGTKDERNNWQIIGDGEGIHWPDLDEDISVEGLLAGKGSMESQKSLARWMDARKSKRQTA